METHSSSAPHHGIADNIEKKTIQIAIWVLVPPSQTHIIYANGHNMSYSWYILEWSTLGCSSTPFSGCLVLTHQMVKKK